MTTHRIDGGLKLCHGLEGNKEEKEGEGDEQNIFVNNSFLSLTFFLSHGLGFPLKSERSSQASTYNCVEWIDPPHISGYSHQGHTRTLCSPS